MNTRKISVCAIAALALGACTNDEIVPSSEAPVTGDGGDGYISFAINMPTTNASRANDVYDYGLEAEYNVNDATLYLFGGASEAVATCYASYGLSATGWEAVGGNITTKESFTQKISKPSSGNLYALVVINGSGVGSTMAPVFTNGVTFSALQSNAVAMDVATIANASDNGNFYMTNAPLYSAKGAYSDPTAGGTSGVVTTLAYIDNTKIYDTEAEAKANPATEIYVERGVAKVTVDGTSTTSGLSGVDVKVEGFVLDLTNLTGYPVRNTQTNDDWWGYASGTLDGVNAGTNQYLFGGNMEVGKTLYRTYWATDPNYNTTLYTSGDSGDRTYPTTVNSLDGTAPAISSLTAADGATGAYCLENTMMVDRMNQDETTRAIIAATIGDGSDFFTFEGNSSVIYTETQICNEVLALFAANPDVEAALSTWTGGEFDFSDYYDAGITYPTDNNSNRIGSSDVTVYIEPGDKTLSENDFSDGVIPSVLTVGTTAFTAVVTAINTAHEFSYYAGGVAYYPVLIKHFGDDLTPWDINGVGETSYPSSMWSKTAEENWLGRYGVLRNNWYDIVVTAINQIGSADVPTAYGEPDDPVESWISIEINILSWAKRTQDVTL